MHLPLLRGSYCDGTDNLAEMDVRHLFLDDLVDFDFDCSFAFVVRRRC